jgi:Undecaprenyl-phosphate glucose phosphotransferase
MALYTASQLRYREPTRPLTPASPRLNAAAAALERLESEGAKPAISGVVVVGLTRIGEFTLLAILGLLLYRATPTPHGVGPGVVFPLTVAASLAATLIFQTLRTYSISAFRFPLGYLIRMWGGWGALCLAMLAASAALPMGGEATRAWLTAWFWLGLVALTVDRTGLSFFVDALARRGRLERRAVVVGGGTEFARDLLHDLANADRAEVRLIGVFDDRNEDRSPNIVEGAPKLGNIDELVVFARAARIDLVIFALPIAAEQRILEMLRKLWVLPVDVRLAAHANRLRLRPRSYSYVGAAPMLDVFDKPLADWDVVLKAAFDRIVGGLALLMLSPIMLAAAIAIKLESRGPILFKQIRYGFNNELIKIYKFRSMRDDVSDVTAEQLVTRNDPRVTRVGRFLRRTSIDELPQLFNVVFRGDLSLIGPRPHAIHAKAADRQYDEVVESYFARHRVKPGITGWAQINGWRGETDTAEKIQKRVDYDLYYIENWSIYLDLYILVMTPVALLLGKNAY